MKTKNPTRLALSALLGASLLSTLSAAVAPSTRVTINDPPLPSAAVRARAQLGGDVFAADGVRVGAVSDFVLQFGALPQLRYVVVRSAGTLGQRATQRAVPADAVTLADHRVHLKLTGPAFRQLPVLPAKPRAFLSNASNQATLAKLAGTPLAHAELTGGFVVFSELSELDSVVGRHGEDLGSFMDLWIDFNTNEAPFLEYDPTSGALDLFGNEEYDVPTTALTRVQTGEIHFKLDESDLAHLRSLNHPGTYVAAIGEKLEDLQAKSPL